MVSDGNSACFAEAAIFVDALDSEFLVVAIKLSEDLISVFMAVLSILGSLVIDKCFAILWKKLSMNRGSSTSRA